MIKDILLDVDGVIVGEKIGINSPWPHKNVVSALSDLSKKNIRIHLVTAKPYWAIEKIVKDSKLEHFHIVEGGAMLIDALDLEVLEKHTVPTKEMTEVLSLCLEKGIYVEIYTPTEYFVERSQVSEITEKHTHILQRKPTIVPSIVDTAKLSEVIKIMPIAKNESIKLEVDELLSKFKSLLHIAWAVHPVALPLQFSIITKKGVSKSETAKAMAKYIDFSFDTSLGIGDSTSDWDFIKLCKYTGTLENASGDLKELVLSKGKDNSTIGGHVDKNGVLDIFRFYKLI